MRHRRSRRSATVSMSEAIHQPARTRRSRGPCRCPSGSVPRGSSARFAIPGPSSLTTTLKSCGGASPSIAKLDAAAARVAKRVARDLRDGRRDARLILAVEAEQLRDLARALARRRRRRCSRSIAHGQERKAHGALRAMSAVDSAHHDRGVVTAAAEVAVEDGGDDAGMAVGKTRVVVELPVRGEAVGVQHQQRARRPRISELLDASRLVPERAVVRDEAARSPSPDDDHARDVADARRTSPRRLSDRLRRPRQPLRACAAAPS